MGSSRPRAHGLRSLALGAGALLACSAWSGTADAQYAQLLAVPTAPSWISSGLFSALISTPPLVDEPAAPVEPDDDERLPCGLFFDGAPRLTLFDDPLFREPPAPEITQVWHEDKHGEMVVYDQISRRWDRPAAYLAYVYPVDTRYGWTTVTSGYDLDLPSEQQRRVSVHGVGHGGVDLPQVRGAPIKMIRLAHQVGEARVLHVGTVFGNTVASLHVVREGGARARYVVLFGHLDAANEALKVGKIVREGDVVGAAGDSDSPGGVHLHLEVRRVRDGVAPSSLVADRIVARDVTVVTDPRNVLSLKPGAARGPSCRDQLRERRAGALTAIRLELAPTPPLRDYRALDLR
ncbi:MAG: M23 family metallopeptidase [Myxococcales bacterium]|nr:M23 family metallopeptidase [Myxococcales bacterium]